MLAALLNRPAIAWLLLATGLSPLAAALPAVDPPVQTAPVDSERVISGTAVHAFYHGSGYFDANRQGTLDRYSMPVDGSPWSRQSTTYPVGFRAMGAAQGLVYGLHYDPGDDFPDQFRALDETTQALVASRPITGNVVILKDLKQESGWLVYFRSISGGLARLLRFDAVTRTFSESEVDSVVATFSHHRLAGAGEGWLAFQCYNPLISENKLITVDATTFAIKAQIDVDNYWGAEGIDASGTDTEFLVANGKVIAMNVHTGSSSVVGESVAGAITEAKDIAAHGGDLWVQGLVAGTPAGTSEIQMWRKDGSGQWQMEFRGKPDRASWLNNPFGELAATAQGCFAVNTMTADYYVPGLSKPILAMPSGFLFKDGGGKQALVLELDRPATEPVSICIRNGGGSATAGTDYTAIDQVVNFPAGSTSASIEVDVKEDLVPESHETIELLFSEAQGINLPRLRRGHAVIQASGLELTEVKLLSSSGTPVAYATLLMRDEDVTVGIAAAHNSTSPEKVCLWDNATGALRGVVASFPADTVSSPAAEFLPTPQGIDAYYTQSGNIILARISRLDGALQGSGSFPIPGALRDVVLLGGGRALVSYSPSGGSADWAARLIEIGGPEGGTAFPNPPPHSNGVYPTFISDGRYLISSWGTHSSSFGDRHFLGAFDPATLAPVWQMEMAGFWYTTPQAIRGDILLLGTNDRMLGFDLQTREILWEQKAETGVGAAGDTLWYGGGHGPATYDLATGAKISAPSYLGETTSAIDQIAAAGPGGVLLRDYEYFPIAGYPDPGIRFRLRLVSTRRTRPAVQVLNQHVMQSHDGASFAVRAVEKTDVPVQVSLYHIDSENGGFSKMTIDPAPVNVPMDGSTVGIPYRVQTKDGPPLTFLYANYRIGAAITAPAIAPLAAQVILPLSSGIPVAPAHLGTVVASSPVQQNYPKYWAMRVCDGKLLAFTGKSSGIFSPAYHHIDVIDAATGNLIRRIVDPVPLANRMFGINAIAQGDKLLVVSRMAGGEIGTAEIFQISTGQPLAVLTYKGKLPGFGDSLASNANYFAISIPGMDFGKPAGSQVEVFRWSDYKRAFRKAGGKNSQLGIGMTFHGDILYASSTAVPKRGQERDPAKGKITGFRIGTKGKGEIPVPLATTGTLLEGDSNLIVGNFKDIRAYDWTTMKPKWTKPWPWVLADYRVPISAGSGMVSVRDLRDLMLLSEADGSHIATTRFYTEMDNSLYGDLYGAAISGDHVFTLRDGVITRWPLNALGDFSSWRRFQGTTLAANGPTVDYDRNGTADFDDYVANRLNPAAPFATAEHQQGGKVRVDSEVLPPPDVLAVVEAQLASGLWRAIAWREGHGGWAGRDGSYSATGSLAVNLPAGLSGQAPLRIRYLPSAAFGAAWDDEEWPPADSASSVGSLASSGAADGDVDGLPDWLEAQLGVQAGGAPLGIVSGTAGSGVSFLRPRDGSAAFDVESSADLQFWQSAQNDDGLEITVQPEDAQYERVTIRGKAGVAQRFFRVKY